MWETCGLRGRSAVRWKWKEDQNAVRVFGSEACEDQNSVHASDRHTEYKKVKMRYTHLATQNPRRSNLGTRMLWRDLRRSKLGMRMWRRSLRRSKLGAQTRNIRLPTHARQECKGVRRWGRVAVVGAVKAAGAGGAAKR